MDYPKPEVPYTGHSDLYFATGQQVRSGFSLGNSDRGELSTSPGRVTFRGMRVFVDCPDVTAVRLVRKAFPWVIVAAVGALAVVCIFLQTRGNFSWTYVGVVGVILLVIAFKQSREQWVEVEYAGPDKPRRAYFRREPVFFGSGPARTQALLKEIEGTVLRGATVERTVPA